MGLPNIFYDIYMVLWWMWQWYIASERQKVDQLVIAVVDMGHTWLGNL